MRMGFGECIRAGSAGPVLLPARPAAAPAQLPPTHASTHARADMRQQAVAAVQAKVLRLNSVAVADQTAGKVRHRRNASTWACSLLRMLCMPALCVMHAFCAQRLFDAVSSGSRPPHATPPPPSPAPRAFPPMQIVNLVSNDVRRFDDALPFYNFLIAAPGGQLPQCTLGARSSSLQVHPCRALSCVRQTSSQAKPRPTCQPLLTFWHFPAVRPSSNTAGHDFAPCQPATPYAALPALACSRAAHRVSAGGPKAGVLGCPGWRVYATHAHPHPGRQRRAWSTGVPALRMRRRRTRRHRGGRFAQPAVDLGRTPLVQGGVVWALSRSAAPLRS